VLGLWLSGLYLKMIRRQLRRARKPVLIASYGGFIAGGRIDWTEVT
jgi:hypothetical protein